MAEQLKLIELTISPDDRGPISKRTALFRTLFPLLMSAEIVNRHEWATRTLSKPELVKSFRGLTDDELAFLVDALHPQASKDECQSISPDDRVCINLLHLHGTYCCDEHGNEWLDRY